MGECTIHDILINLLCKCQDTPLHHEHSWRLLPKFSKDITISWNHLEPILPHGTLSSSVRLLHGAKHYFFSDPVVLQPHAWNLGTISHQTLLLVGYCLLPFNMSHCFEHTVAQGYIRTVAYNILVVFVTNRVFTRVKLQTFRFIFGETCANTLFHKTLLTERISWVEYLRRPLLFHVTYYCLTNRSQWSCWSRVGAHTILMKIGTIVNRPTSVPGPRKAGQGQDRIG